MWWSHYYQIFSFITKHCQENSYLFKSWGIQSDDTHTHIERDHVTKETQFIWVFNKQYIGLLTANNSSIKTYVNNVERHEKLYFCQYSAMERNIL
jgi:hypothetical protein